MLYGRRRVKDARIGIAASRSACFGLHATLKYRSFLSVFLKYNPQQPRDSHGRWTNGGTRDPDATGSTKIINDAATGDIEIDSVTEANKQAGGHFG